MNRSSHVVVLGAGYAGMMAAMRLARKTDVSITLVNAVDAFRERLRNHQLVGGAAVPSRPLAALLGSPRIQFIRATVEAVVPGARRVTLRTDTGIRAVEYDRLVYALGSVGGTGATPGASEHAYTLDHAPAEALAGRLPELARRVARVLVVGGGPLGVETATEIADAHPGTKVQLVTRGRLAPRFSDGARAYMRATLDRLGASVVEHTAIVEVRPQAAIAADGRVFPFDACVWAAGFEVSDLPRRAGLRVNARGQILTDRTLRSLSHRDVYAAGDAAMPAEAPGAPARMSVAVALMMGAHAADCLAAELRGRTPTAFGMSYIAAGITLGRRNGLVQFLNPSSDTPTDTIVTGRVARVLRDVFARFPIAMIRAQGVAPWLFEWPGRRKMRHLPVTAPQAAGVPPRHPETNARAG